MARRSWDWKAIEAQLIEQGWRVEHKDAHHARCIPPDKGKAVVHCSTTGKHPRGTRNAMQQLKQSGFDPDYEPPQPERADPGMDGARDDLLPEFGTTLKRLRDESNLKQGELGDLLGVSGNTISHWEKGRSAPHNAETYRKLCELLPELRSAKAPVFKRQCKEKPAGRGPLRHATPVEAALDGLHTKVPDPPPTLESQADPKVEPPPTESEVRDSSPKSGLDLVMVAVNLAESLHGSEHTITFTRSGDAWEAVLADGVRGSAGAYANTAATPTLALRGILSALRTEAEQRRAELDRLMAAAREGA